MTQYFYYTDDMLEALQKRDKALAQVIHHVGPIRRPVEPDLFLSLIRAIVAQQISSKAADTVFQRLLLLAGAITPESILRESVEAIQLCGISLRKASYIISAAEEVQSGRLDIEGLQCCSDEEVIKRLSALKGIGVWTAEMLLLFSMNRQDVFSFDDLAIQRGLRMLYHHRKITRELFEKYRRRFSPYCSLASLYIYAISGGAIGDGGAKSMGEELGLKDYAPLTEAEQKKRRRQRALKQKERQEEHNEVRHGI